MGLSGGRPASAVARSARRPARPEMARHEIDRLLHPLKRSVEKTVVSFKSSTSPERKEAARRPYRRPRLTDLGDVRELTQALITMKGALDGMTIGAMDLKTGGL